MRVVGALIGVFVSRTPDVRSLLGRTEHPLRRAHDRNTLASSPSARRPRRLDRRQPRRAPECRWGFVEGRLRHRDFEPSDCRRP